VQVKTGRITRFEKERILIPTTPPEGVIGTLPLLRRVVSVLLAMPVRVQYLHGLYAG